MLGVWALLLTAILLVPLAWILKDKVEPVWRDLPASASLAAAAVALWSSIQTLGVAQENLRLAKDGMELSKRNSEAGLDLSKKQLMLQLRPFVAGLNPTFAFGFDESAQRHWLKIKFQIRNFGSQPAHEFVRRNDKVGVIYTDPELATLRRVLSNPLSTTTVKDLALEAVVEARRRRVEKLYDHLRANPSASMAQLKSAFRNGGDVALFGDIDRYFQPPTALMPNQSAPSGSGRDIGTKDGPLLADGEAALFYFVSFEYEGAVKGKRYSTFYLGYFDRFLSRSALQKNIDIEIQEFRQWMDRDEL